MFGGFFQRLGNLVTGNGWESDEEKRRKQQQAQAQSAAAPSISTPQTSLTVAQPKQIFNLPEQNQNTPRVSQLDVLRSNPTVKVGDFSYTKNNDGTYTEQGSGAKRSQAQIDSLQAGQNQARQFRETVPTTLDNVGAAAGGATIGTLTGLAKVPGDLAEGIVSLPSLVTHAANSVANGLAGKGFDTNHNDRWDFTKGVDNLTNTVNTPFRFINDNLQAGADNIGPEAAQAAREAEVVGNAATIAVPGAQLAGILGNAARAGKVAQAAGDISKLNTPAKIGAILQLDKAAPIVDKINRTLNNLPGSSSIDNALSTLSRGRYGNPLSSEVGATNVAKNAVDESVKLGDVTRKVDEPSISSPNLPKIAEKPNLAPLDVGGGEVASTGKASSPSVTSPNVATTSATPSAPIISKLDQLSTAPETSSVKLTKAQQKKLDQQALAQPEQAPVDTAPLTAPTKTPTELKGEAAPQPTPVVNSPTAPPVSSAVAESTPLSEGDIADVTKQVNDIISSAAADGVDYPSLVNKLAHNFEVTSKRINEPLLPLSQEEATVAQRVQAVLEPIRKKYTQMGIKNEDLGLIGGENYLPTAKLGGERLGSTSDLIDQGAGFANKRSGALTPEERSAGATQALEDYLRTGKLLDKLSPSEIDYLKNQRLQTANRDLFDTPTDATGQPLSPVTPDPGVLKTLDEQAQGIVEQERLVQSLDSSTPEWQQANDILSGMYTDYVNNRLIEANKAIDEAVKQVKAANLPNRRATVRQLNEYKTKINRQERYQQNFVHMNVLSTVGGRLADQANKGLHLGSNLAFGKASRALSNRVLRGRNGGKDVLPNDSQVKDVYSRVKSMPVFKPERTNFKRNLTVGGAGKGRLGKAYNATKSATTFATGIGSTSARAGKDTVAFLVRSAREDGLTNTDEITKYVTQALNGKTGKQTFAQAYGIDNQFTGVPTLRSEPGSLVRSKPGPLAQTLIGWHKTLDAAVDKIPGLTPATRDNIVNALSIDTLGFPRTVANIGLAAGNVLTGGASDIVRALRMAPRSPADTLKQAEMLARGFRTAATAGSLLPLGIGLAKANLISGSYPDDAKERAQWKTEGKLPYSVNIGGKWVDISRYMGIYGVPLLMGAAFAESNGIKDAPSVVGHIVAETAKNFGADNLGTFFKDTSDLIAGHNVDKIASKYGSGFVKAFLPLDALLRTTANATDATQRSTTGTNPLDTLGRSVAADIPRLRHELNPKTDVFGNTMTQTPLDAITTSTSKPQQSTPLTAELDRLSGSNIQAYPGDSTYTLKGADNKTVDLNPLQKEQLNNAVNSEKQRSAELLLSTDAYKSASDAQKGEMLKNVYSTSSARTASQWAKDNGVSGVKAADGLNSGISEQYQQAIVAHDALTKDAAKAWLDDNQHASDYYTGVYENAKANGPISKEEDSLLNKSGMHYRAVAAQVDAKYNVDFDLKQAYQMTTQAQWRKMGDPESSEYDPGLYQSLAEYDQARTKAGVSDGTKSNKPKYTVSTAGSGRKKTLTLASVPDIAGTIKRAGGASYSSNDGRLYKPIADLIAPSTTVKAPRTISVKKGVHL